LPVGVGQDGAVRPNDVPQCGDNRVGATDNAPDAAQGCVNEDMIARAQSDCRQIGGKAPARYGLGQLLAPA
jgi:hypothetical protein